ncbi:polyprenyl synthetase [Halobacteriales archaeon QS_1_68_20]|nr:MAG: polyprenyl synthetase [Halobacteriales archaeon QS_1_68_20]
MRDVLEEWKPVVDGTIEDVFPRDVSREHLESYFGEARYGYDVESIQASIVDPVWDLLDRGGKRWRPVIFLLFVDAFGEDPEEYLPYATIPELIHNGTIIVDDIEDGAEMRRGEPALHHIYGVDVALNAGNALYFVPLKILSKDPVGIDDEDRLRAYDMLMHEMNRTHLGQGVDIDWHNDPGRSVAEVEYLEMCACKTGCLARLAAQLAAIVTGQSRETQQRVADYAELMSLAFQINDDILDVEHSLDRAGDFGKAFGNDVREGKTTLLVIHAVENSSGEDAEKLLDILAADENTDEEISEAIRIIDESGAIEQARERAFDLAEEARQSLEGLDLDPEPRERLEAFARFVVEREV